MHAEIVVIDEHTALVGSANVTSRAMQAKLECGNFIRGGPEPSAIGTHISDLQGTGDLHRS